MLFSYNRHALLIDVDELVRYYQRNTSMRSFVKKLTSLPEYSEQKYSPDEGDLLDNIIDHQEHFSVRAGQTFILIQTTSWQTN